MNELLGRSNGTNMVAVEESASIAEIQAKMILARNFPRSVDVCLEYIKRECQNKELAESLEIKQAPTLVVVDNGIETAKAANLSNIKKYIETSLN